MTDFAINTVATEHTITPVELGRWAEEHGFEAVFFGEHTHVPERTVIPDNVFFPGGKLPDFYYGFYDPMIAMAQAAAVTERLKVGVAVSLVPIHHPIALAKTIATLDRVSGGRVIFGIGAGGWNVEEIEDYGVEFKDRWKVTREHVLAMREIWSNEVASYSGEYVDIQPMKAWPKPVQSGGPTILMGAQSKWSPARIVEYCDGWIPVDGFDDIEDGVEAIRAAAEKAGRPMSEIDLSIITGNAAPATEQRISELVALGFNRIVFYLEAVPAEGQWPILEQYAALLSTVTREAPSA